MLQYEGPERRTLITFTREDSDRLVRLEQKTISTNEKLDKIIASSVISSDAIDKKVDESIARIVTMERRLSWIAGLGTGFAFIISCVLAYFKTH
jgi:hypothetical protein